LKGNFSSLQHKVHVCHHECDEFIRISANILCPRIRNSISLNFSLPKPPSPSQDDSSSTEQLLTNQTLFFCPWSTTVVVLSGSEKKLGGKFT